MVKEVIETENKKQTPKSWMEYVETLKRKEFEEVSDENLFDFFIEIKRIYNNCLDELLYRNLKGGKK